MRLEPTVEHINICVIFILKMIDSKIISLILIVTAAVSAPISIQNALASNIITNDDGIEEAYVDVLEAAEAGNTTMMTNQTEANGNTTGVEFLSIQTAQSGSISQINATAYTLELNNVANETIQFSDRPERVIETVSTADFVGNWSAGPNSFAVDAPNDALIVEDTQTGELETAIVELFDPIYDSNTNTLTYTITTENATAIGLPGEFEQSVLVVDMQPLIH